jgi:exopolyphosphatase/guanosine-5'-triphosphate,3'-diphosphate pyrophosphatase
VETRLESTVPTSLATMSMNLATYDPARVHCSRLTMAALDAQIARLRRATQNEREHMIGLDPRRADVILAEVTVSDRGIRWGLFCERAAPA